MEQAFILPQKIEEKSFFSRHQTACILFLMFLASVIVRTIIGGFSKHISVMFDELIYYAQAESLIKRGYFAIYDGSYIYQGTRVLYSLLIAPAF